MLALSVVDGDITQLEVDAIANAANDRLWMGAGVAGAIKRAGGEEIEREAVAKGPIDVGDAVATGAGALAARWVIHGAVMGQDLRTSAELVERTDPRGFPYFWFGLAPTVETPGHKTDLEAIADGYVTVTPLHLDLTHDPSLEPLRKKIAAAE